MITLVLGGTRSGKSDVAESLATAAGAESGVVTYIATGQATDSDMAGRIAVHQARRARGRWSTVEAGEELPDVLRTVAGPALVDSLGTWVARFVKLDPDVVALCEALRARRDRGDATVLVAEEVGLGVHATSAAGRRFADVLGELNGAVADLADRVLLVVAGRVLPLDRWDSGPPR